MRAGLRRPERLRALASAFVSLSWFGCGASQEGVHEVDGEAEVDVETGADVETETEVDVETETETEVDVETETETETDELDPQSYCERTVDVFCPYYLRCGRMAVSDLESCRAVFLETCNARYEPLYAALAERGALALSADGIARCAEHLETVACAEQIFDLDGGCDAVWVGRVAAGGACGTGIESFVCDPSSTCVLGLDFCGTCAPLTEGACDFEHRCPDDGVCKDGACRARPRVGDACDGEVACVLGADCVAGACAGPTIVALGDACDATRRCPYRSACVGGRCASMALLGEPCGPGGCASGVCEQGVCAALIGPGEPCERAAQCVSGRCDAGLCARPSSTCVP